MDTNSFSEEEIKEFIVEAEDLLEQAETNLIEIDKGGGFLKLYDSIFRVFHSLKGGAGMLGLSNLQSHMHQVESIFTPFKAKGSITKLEINFFLNGIDGARKIIAGEEIVFEYSIDATENPSNSSTTPLSEIFSVLAPTIPPVVLPVTLSVPSTPKKSNISTDDKLIAYIVDDEPEILSILSDILTNGGFYVECFDKPEDLIEKVAKCAPDVVLSDMKMPTLSGLDVLKSCKKIDPLLPVIFISGYLTLEILLDAIKQGVYAAVEKPFNVSMVLNYSTAAANSYKTMKLFNRSINLILYQYSDLDDFLKTSGKDDIRKTIQTEVNLLLSYRKRMKDFAK